MGKGINLARPMAPEHAAALDDLKDQLLIVFLKRLQQCGQALDFPLSEIDNTAQDTVAFSVRRGLRDCVFHFELRKQQ